MSASKVGRPHTRGITEALVAAAERVMITRGFSALTVDGLVTEVGTTRPTFYRRFPSVAHIALAVVKLRFGTGSTPRTGSLAADLRAMQREEVAMFAEPLMRNNVVGLLEAARTAPDLLSLYAEEFIGPRRARVADVLDAAAERGELDASDIDVNEVCDLLLGPILARALLPLGAPLDDRLADLTARSALLHLGLDAPS
ncbi:MAG: TetR/AcrR family transcriptional regulator [Microbacterium arborescens]